MRLGAEWAGDAMAPGPEPLDAAIIFAPAGELVPAALRATAPGGVVVCAGIHMSDIPSFPYENLWHERMLRSVANLTRADAHEFLSWRRRCRSAPPCRSSRSRRPRRRSTACAPARSRARPCSEFSRGELAVIDGAAGELVRTGA